MKKEYIPLRRSQRSSPNPPAGSKPRSLVSAPTQPDKLENWERDWMEEVQRRKRQRAKEE